MLSSEILKRFDVISKLERNWDGDDADPVTPDLLVFAKKVAAKVIELGIPEPFIGATPIGSFDFDWGSRFLVVLGIPEDGITIITMGPPTMETYKYDDYTYVDHVSEKIVKCYNMINDQKDLK